LNPFHDIIFQPYIYILYNIFRSYWSVNWLYAQLHYFLNFSQLLVSCLALLAKLI